MNLLDLPEEVLVEILRRLDIVSLLVVWETCTRLRQALCQYAVMGRVAPSSRASLLWSTPFIDLAPYVSELNLSGLPGLTPAQVLCTVRPLISLRALDVTGTRLTMWDAGTACKACPTVTSLATRFNWPELQKHLFRYGEEYCHSMVENCQRSFCRLRHVRFVSNSEEILECSHILHVLQLATEVRTLQVDISGQGDYYKYHMHHFDCNQPIPPSLRIFSINNGDNYAKNHNDPHALLLQFRNANWQTLSLAKSDSAIKLYMTDALQKRLKPDLVKSLETRKVAYNYPQQVMWHVNLEKHNYGMYDAIIEKVLEVIPEKLCKEAVKTNDHSSCRFYNVSPCVLRPVINRRAPKRARTSVVNFNLDECVAAVPNVRVSVKENWCSCRTENLYRENAILYFDIESTTLRNLQFLSIEDCVLDSSFEALFQTCRNLQTLILAMYNPKENHSFFKVAQNIHFSTSIKDFKCVANMIAYDVLSECTYCPSLENVVVTVANDSGPGPAAFVGTIVDLFNRCPNFKKLTLEFSALNIVMTPETVRRYIDTMLSESGRDADVKINVFYNFYGLAGTSSDMEEFNMLNSQMTNCTKLLSSIKFNLE